MGCAYLKAMVFTLEEKLISPTILDYRFLVKIFLFTDLSIHYFLLAQFIHSALPTRAFYELFPEVKHLFLSKNIQPSKELRQGFFSSLPHPSPALSNEAITSSD